MTDDPDKDIDDLDLRRKRASYRAHHRGTKEMDWLISRYADHHLGQMSEPELLLFEEFLVLPDPELQNWIMGTQNVNDRRFAGLVDKLRCFHGLQSRAG